MSWDVVVFDFHGSPPPIDEWEGDSGAPLGSPDEVRRRIDASLPGVDWSDPETGIYEGDEFSFEISILEKENVENLVIAVRGSGDAVAALLQLATPHRWSLLDGSTSEWIDPANPSNAGWEDFQEFRDRALATMTAEEERAPEPSGVAEETGVSEERDSERSSPLRSASESSVAEASKRPSGRKVAPRKKKKASKKKAAVKRKTGVKKAAKGKKKGAAKRTAPKKKAAGKKKDAVQKKVARRKKAAAKKAAPRKKEATAKRAKKAAKKRVAKKSAKKGRK